MDFTARVDASASEAAGGSTCFPWLLGFRLAIMEPFSIFRCYLGCSDHLRSLWKVILSEDLKKTRPFLSFNLRYHLGQHELHGEIAPKLFAKKTRKKKTHGLRLQPISFTNRPTDFIHKSKGSIRWL